jgi:hypothetical protein
MALGGTIADNDLKQIGATELGDALGTIFAELIKTSLNETQQINPLGFSDQQKTKVHPLGVTIEHESKGAFNIGADGTIDIKSVTDLLTDIGNIVYGTTDASPNDNTTTPQGISVLLFLFRASSMRDPQVHEKTIIDGVMSMDDDLYTGMLRNFCYLMRLCLLTVCAPNNIELTPAYKQFINNPWDKFIKAELQTHLTGLLSFIQAYIARNLFTLSQPTNVNLTTEAGKHITEIGDMLGLVCATLSKMQPNALPGFSGVARLFREHLDRPQTNVTITVAKLGVAVKNKKYTVKGDIDNMSQSNTVLNRECQEGLITFVNDNSSYLRPIAQRSSQQRSSGFGQPRGFGQTGGFGYTSRNRFSDTGAFGLNQRQSRGNSGKFGFGQPRTGQRDYSFGGFGSGSNYGPDPFNANSGFGGNDPFDARGGGSRRQAPAASFLGTITGTGRF